ncbi:MAG: starch synthase [Parcubacteria group bacterium 20-58-5]|nr:MAG: starch synthase [Parcubacteria group bacterium 20-58-5]
MTLQVLSVTSEIFPLLKTGGLADVTGALPAALAAQDVAVTTLVPGYPAVLAALAEAEPGDAFTVFGHPARLLRGRAAGLELCVLDAPALFGRPGNPYTAPDGRDWLDNPFRFAALGQAAAGLARRGGFDVLHAHDWQAGLALAYLQFSEGQRPGTVMTVHNLAFQGLFDAALLGPLGLPPAAYTMEGIEFYGQIGFLKAGLAFADRITTVSPRYAAEIQTAAHGMALDGLLRARGAVLQGILNGIDETVWDPAQDRLIAARFDAGRLAARRPNKRALQARFALPESADTLVFAVISRLSWQKGLDLLLDSLQALLALGAQLVVLGSGEPELERGFAAAAAAHPGRIGCVIGYDEPLAHQIQAGADALLVPSRFEPCGLTQLCALRYGAVPVVARVGGLADTVIDANEAAIAAGVATGVQFGPGELDAALRRTAALWRAPESWARLQANGTRSDVSWRRPAAQYAALYRALAAAPAG